MKRTIPPAVQAVLDALEALPEEQRVLAVQLAVASSRPPRPSRRFVRAQPRARGAWLGRIDVQQDPTPQPEPNERRDT